MRKFFHSIKFKITVAVCVCLLLGIFIAAVSGNGASPLSSALSVIMTPLGNGSEYISRKLESFGAGFVSSSKYMDEIVSLQNEIENYKAQLVEHEKLKQKLRSYEAFLEVKEDNPDYTFLPASVIFRNSSDLYSSFTVNKGRKDGVKINQPVIYGKHLVGVIKEVFESSAVVYTLFDPTVSVSAYEIRTREDCYTESDTALTLQGMIKISGLSRSTPVVPGGIVCTSGIGGIYPRDLIIGTVTQVTGNETDISAFGCITPDVDITSIVDVFVITDFSGKAK